MNEMLEAFVKASMVLVESRDPTTAGHSQRVATLTVGLAEMADVASTGPFRELRFTREQVDALRYASLLHDIGMIGVREKVLVKGKKLYVGEMLLIRQRMAFIKRSLESEYLRARLEAVVAGQSSPELLAQMRRDYDTRREELDQLLKTIMQANEPTILEEDSFRALMDLPSRTFTDIDGNRQPFLTSKEAAALCIRRGSLSEKERLEIQTHVTYTFLFLSQIPWTGEFRRVPEIAYAHHEKLDGSGYPRRLMAAEIPIESKMMTISDIFDVLVAWDRPYKNAIPVEKALDILQEEARGGKLDQDLLDLFIAAKVYARPMPEAGLPAKG